MKSLIILFALLQVIHAEGSWTPKTNAAKEGDEPAYGSNTYKLDELLFNVPKSSSGRLPKEASVVSATCKQLGSFKGRKVIEANISLSGRGYSELLLILCADEEGYRVVLASFQDRAAQYFEVLSVENNDQSFIIKTRYSIPGTDPYSSNGSILIEEKAGKLVMR